MVSSVSNSTFSPSKPAGMPAQLATAKPEADVTLRTAMTRLLVVSTLFCAVPPLYCQSRIPTRRLRCCLHAVYQIVFFATITVCMVFNHLYFLGTIPRIQTFLYTVSYFMNAGNNAFILTGAFAVRQFYWAYHAEMLAIDKRLHGIDTSYAAAAGYARLQRFVAGWLAVVAAVLGTALVIDTGFNSLCVGVFLRSWIVYIVTNVTVCLFVLQFVTVLRALCDKYATINGMLERKFMRRCGGDEAAVVVVATIEGATVEPPHLQASRCEAALNSVRSIHFRLNRLNERATDTFGRVLCSVFVWTVLVLTIQLFQLYTFARKFEADQDSWLLAYTAVWSLLYAGRMFVVFVYSARLNAEKRKVVDLLYRMDLEGRVKMTRRVDQCIHKFSLQMLHEQRVQTACGILQLDMTLVATMFGALTSYLVILIQFDFTTRNVNDI